MFFNHREAHVEDWLFLKGSMEIHLIVSWGEAGEVAQGKMTWVRFTLQVPIYSPSLFAYVSDSLTLN